MSYFVAGEARVLFIIYDENGSSHSKTKTKPRHPQRQNAAMIIENSNVCPFYCRRSTFLCIYCLGEYTDFRELRRHTAENHKPVGILKTLPRTPVKVDMTALQCRLCSKSMEDLNELISHLIFIHKKVYNDRLNEGVIAFKLVTDDEYKCHVCNERFPAFYNLNRHINAHYSNYFCEYCARTFVTESRLKTHLASHETGCYPCERCGKKYMSSLKLKSHLNSAHLKRSRLKCPQCPAKFVEHHVKIKHMRDVHDLKMTFECRECLLVFNSRRAYTKHRQKVHLPQFVCDVCGKSYIQRSLLKIHELAVHSDVNFACSFCSKSYKRNSTLKKHMKVHKSRLET